MGQTKKIALKMLILITVGLQIQPSREIRLIRSIRGQKKWEPLLP
jgi:hypothetical protein